MNLIICYIVFILGLLLLVINAIRISAFKSEKKLINKLSNYLKASSVEGSVCFALYFLYPNNNFFISHFFFNVQLIFISLFFYELFQDLILKQYVKYSAITVFTISLLQYIIKPDSFWQFNLFEIISVCCLLISFGLIHLYNTLGEVKHYFFFSLGIIMYFLCSCLLYLFGGFTLVFLQDPYIDHWIVKDLFFLIYQVLIWKEIKLITKKSDV